MFNTTPDDNALEKSLARHTTAQLIAAGFNKILSLILIKTLTLFLPKVEYSLYVFWLSFAMLLSAYSTAAFSTTIWRFMERKRLDKNENSASILITTSVTGSLIMSVIGVAIVGILYIVTNLQLIKASDYILVLLLTEGLTIALIFKELILVISGTEQNSREIFTFNIMYASFSASLAGLVAYFTGTYMLALVGLVLGYAIPVFISLAIKIRQYGISSPRYSIFKDSLSYGGPLAFTNAIILMIPFIVYMMTEMWIGVSEIGTLSIAFQISGILAFLIEPFILAYFAYIVRAFETQRMVQADLYSVKLVELTLIGIVLMVMWILILSPELVLLIATDAYLDAVNLIPFITIAQVLTSLAYFWRARIILNENTKIIAMIYSISLVVLLTSSFITIPIMGLIGVGVSLLLNALIIIGLTIGVSYTKSPLHIHRFFVVRLLFSTMVCILSFWILCIQLDVHLWISGLLSSMMYAICVFGTRILSISEMKKIMQLFLFGNNDSKTN